MEYRKVYCKDKCSLFLPQGRAKGQNSQETKSLTAIVYILHPAIAISKNEPTSARTAKENIILFQDSSTED